MITEQMIFFLHLTPLAVSSLQVEGEEKEQTQFTACPTMSLKTTYLKCTCALFSSHEINYICPHVYQFCGLCS